MVAPKSGCTSNGELCARNYPGKIMKKCSLTARVGDTLSVQDAESCASVRQQMKSRNGWGKVAYSACTYIQMIFCDIRYQVMMAILAHSKARTIVGLGWGNIAIDDL